MMDDLLQRLRNGEAPLSDPNLKDEAADEIERLRADAAKLRTVMVAAAEEIHEHWDAHCDAEGYGPANLMRRLEDGIPSEYGYTAGAFAALRADAARYRWLRDHAPGQINFDHIEGNNYIELHVPFDGAPINNDAESAARIDAAIDAAMKGE